METEFNRLSAEEEAKKESAKADMKQHADKIIQGFEKLNKAHANRAIWELVQNACDLTNECEVVIDFSNGGFSFSHNGKPFTSKTLISLIKQVSSKSDDNDNEIGQFGTGFITTHSFGKCIQLNSILKEQNIFIDIKDFEIDRQAKNSEDLLDKLERQQNSVYKLIREGKTIEPTQLKTTFSYIPSHPNDRIYVEHAEQNLHDYIPIVLSLNESLKSVKVVSSNGSIINYRKEDEILGSIIAIPISKDGVIQKIYCLRSENKNIQIVLPLIEENKSKPINKNLAKLFLYFPLIGTEKWGCNFIIHSRAFAPTEPRDGVHLASTNDQTKDKEAGNKIIINQASQLIFDFMEAQSKDIADSVNLSYIDFLINSESETLNKYYKELKNKWINSFRKYELVDTCAGKLTPEKVHFFSPQLLLDKPFFDSIYTIVSMFWADTIPMKGIVHEWTNIVTGWADETLQIITIEMIVEKIQIQALNYFDPIVLHEFYQYLIKFNESKFFSSHSLLPNIKGELAKKEELKTPKNIDDKYISIAEVIIADIPKQFLDEKFELDLEFSIYNRKNLSDDFNLKILATIKEISQSKNYFINERFKSALIDLCCIFASENVQSLRKQVMPKICSFYEKNYTEQIIQNIEEERFDYDSTPLKSLVKIFLNEVNHRATSDVNWVEKNCEFLKDCLAILLSTKEIGEVVETVAVFPNQNFKLCFHNQLVREKEFPLKVEDAIFLKDTFTEVIDDIREDLVLGGFEKFLSHNNEKSGLDLSSKLEHEFKIGGPLEQINEHPKKPIILKIVKRISDDNYWAEFFPALADKKAVIMMSKIEDKEMKEDFFSILAIDDKKKVSLLGSLSKNPDMERIISLGGIALDDIKRNDADFEFKKKIGVHIENLIREKIKDQVKDFKVEVIEKQDGQDILVKVDENIIRYIEVKSRWNKASSIIMSNRQIKNAVHNKEKYTLCSVDMSDYNPEGVNRYEVKEIDEIMSNIKLIDDIGYRIEPLIEKALSVENNEDEVKLADDYRATIPQTIIIKGISLESYVNVLIKDLGLVNE